MRRLRSFFLIFSFVFLLGISNLFATEYVVQTSRGEIEVSIPDGYSELDAFLEMSVLYLEERFDHENLLETVDGLKEVQSKYIADNKSLQESYNILENRYSELSKLYTKRINELQKVKIVAPSFGVSLNTSLDFSVDMGVVLFEKLNIGTIYTYPDKLGIRVGFII